MNKVQSHKFPVVLENGKHAKVLVRPNNDGCCIWYVFLLVDGNEEEIPEQFDYIHGDLDVSVDEDPKLFAKAERQALKVAAKLVKFYAKAAAKANKQHIADAAKAGKLSIRVHSVKFGRQTASVKFTASAKRRTVKCSSPLFHDKGSIRIKEVVHGSKVRYHAELLNHLEDGFVEARTPDKAFAIGARTFWG